GDFLRACQVRGMVWAGDRHGSTRLEKVPSGHEHTIWPHQKACPDFHLISETSGDFCLEIL
ncbi:MAG TPA: hypothetical protein VN648_27535, partial [Candidatus Methylomirabilis sp.]|nr:hypothetical protein [Candidatus Methylomirabilis sp.]